MNRVIICSPLDGDTEANVEYARRCLRHSFDQGEAPFASHLLYPQILDDTDERARARAMQAEFEWIDSADIVAFYIDLGWSKGMIAELKVARMYKRTIETRTLNPTPNLVRRLLQEPTE